MLSLRTNTCELSLVCPAFNEAENLGQLLAEWDASLRSTGQPYEMIVVDDGSTDATPLMLRTALRSFLKLRILRLEVRSGQSAALAAGCDAARGRWIVTSDADLQNDPTDLPRLLELSTRFDMVCGWRKERRDNWSKRVTSWFANRHRRNVLGDGMHDTACGFKLFRREVAERVLRFNGMHRFLPALAQIAGFTVTEIPVRHRSRVHGTSKYWIFNRFLRPIRDLHGVAWFRARALNYSAQEVTEQRTEVHPMVRAG